MKRAHPTLEAAEAWGERMQRTAKTGVDSGQTLGAYVTHIGDRWTRGIHPTSTSVPDGCANRQRATPTDGWAAAKRASRRAPGPSLAGRRASRNRLVAAYEPDRRSSPALAGVVALLPPPLRREVSLRRPRAPTHGAEEGRAR